MRLMSQTNHQSYLHPQRRRDDLEKQELTALVRNQIWVKERKEQNHSSQPKVNWNNPQDLLQVNQALTLQQLLTRQDPQQQHRNLNLKECNHSRINKLLSNSELKDLRKLESRLEDRNVLFNLNQLLLKKNSTK